MSTFLEVLFYYFTGFAVQYFFLTAFYYSKEQETNRKKAFYGTVNADGDKYDRVDDYTIKYRINITKIIFSFFWFACLIPMVLMYIINRLNKEY